VPSARTASFAPLVQFLHFLLTSAARTCTLLPAYMPCIASCLQVSELKQQLAATHSQLATLRQDADSRAVASSQAVAAMEGRLDEAKREVARAQVHCMQTALADCN
jgi:hypothetical protein